MQAYLHRAVSCISVEISRVSVSHNPQLVYEVKEFLAKEVMGNVNWKLQSVILFSFHMKRKYFKRKRKKNCGKTDLHAVCGKA